MADEMLKLTMDDVEIGSEAKPKYAFSDPNQWCKYTSVDYKAVNKYTFMSQAFEGEGGFHDGTYIVPYGREMFYEERKIMSAYCNYIRPMVRSMYEPVFNEKPNREITVNGVESTSLIVNEFVADVNGAGMSIDDFTKNAVGLVKLHSVTFVIVDNFSEEELAEVKRTEDAKNCRMFPYSYIKTADQVLECDIKTDKFGNLIQIAFVDEPDEVDKDNPDRWRRWTPEYSVLIKKSKGPSAGEGPKYVEAGPQSPIEIGFMPVYAAYDSLRVDPKKVLTKPSMYELAILNTDLFNRDSQIIDHERSQAFGIFYVQTNNLGNLQVGLHNVLAVSIDASMEPGFASPDPGILEGLVNNREKAKENMYQVAEQNGVSGIANESGLAKSYDFFSGETILKNSATVAENVENFLIKCQKAYCGEEYDFMIEYEKDYKPGSKDTLTSSFETLVDMGAPAALRLKMWKDIFDMWFPAADKDEREEVFASFGKEYVDEMNSKESTNDSDNQDDE